MATFHRFGCALANRRQLPEMAPLGFGSEE
jgi:hypothetical protein